MLTSTVKACKKRDISSNFLIHLNFSVLRGDLLTTFGELTFKREQFYHFNWLKNVLIIILASRIDLNLCKPDYGITVD